MAKKKNQKTFQVWARVNVLATVNVPADTLEQAVEVSKTLTSDDFLYEGRYDGTVEDTELNITGVMEN